MHEGTFVIIGVQYSILLFKDYGQQMLSVQPEYNGVSAVGTWSLWWPYSAACCRNQVFSSKWYVVVDTRRTITIPPKKD